MKKIIVAALSLALAGGMPSAASSQSNGARPEMAVQVGHGESVQGVAILADGKFAVTGSDDTTAKLWDLSTGDEIRTFKHGRPVICIAVSKDGKFLVTGSLDSTVKLWDLATGEMLRTFNGHAQSVASVAISPDGRWLVTGSWDKTAKLWNLSTGQETRTFSGNADMVLSVAISPDGKYVVAGSNDHTIKLYNLSTGEEVRTFIGGPYIAISADGRYLAANYGIAAKLWNLTTGEEIRSFKGHPDNIYSLGLSPDGKTLATGSHDQTVKLWDFSTGEEIRTITSDDMGSVFSLAFSPDGKNLITGSSEHSSKLWDLSTGNKIRAFQGHTSAVNSVAFGRDGKALITGNGDNTADVWDVSNGEEVRTFKGHAGSVSSARFSPDGKSLVTGSGDKTANLWDLSTGAKLKTFSGHAEQVRSAAVTPDGKTLVTGSWDNTAKLWDLSTGAEIRTFSGHADAVTSIAITPDGKALATGSWDKTAKLWDLSIGQVLRTFTGHTGWVTSVAVSSDGKYLVTGSDDKTAKLWNLSTGMELRTFRGHWSNIDAVAVSADLRFVATGSLDHSARLWNLSTGEELRSFDGHANGVLSVAFAPDGRTLATGSTDGTMRIWDTASGRELCRVIRLETGWVVVTPDGYFDGSPEGMKSIRWTVGLQSFPLESFSEGYYVPGLLARVLAGEKITGAKSLAHGFALPPLVKITSPRNGAAFENESADVTVRAADQGGGVDEIRLYQNGKALGGEARGMKSASLAQTFHVTLVDGDNVFKAVALSRDRIESNPDEITVVYKGPQKRAALHVLVVGVNRYKNSDLNLNYAQPDAQAISDFFGSAPGTLFAATTNRGLFDAQATKAGILAELAALKTSAPQDVVVIYLAGHGESIGNAWYFVPYDLVYPEQEDEVKAKGLSSDELRDAIRGMGAQKVLLMMDACKSGGALVAFAGRGVEDRKALSMLARAAGVHVVAASTKDQIAAEVKPLGHGVFTYTLLEGLKGGAAKNGVVTVASLLAYIQSELPEISLKYKTQAQYPVVDSRGMDFPLTTGR